MVRIGYALSSEEFGPNPLVRFAVRAEEAGFEFAKLSDHYLPWVEAQGKSPFPRQAGFDEVAARR